ncbi:rab-GTPase-TBC domain-containing protein [Paraphysoderma sedebokerense]|nr:rab-GTPase-TBC domain-containing protein [Paraphysoderma sedebokerense]
MAGLSCCLSTIKKFTKVIDSNVLPFTGHGPMSAIPPAQSTPSSSPAQQSPAADSSNTKGSFWKRSSKLPGRPLSTPDHPSSKVVGAQYTFGTPGPAVGREKAASDLTDSQPTSHTSSPKPSRSQQSKANTQFIDTDDTWDDDLSDDPTDLNNDGSRSTTQGKGSPSAADSSSEEVESQARPKSHSFSENFHHIHVPKLKLNYGSDKKADQQQCTKQQGKDADQATAAEVLNLSAKIAKYDKFRAVLESQNVDLAALRKLSWNGIPEELRPMCWQLLMGYLPCPADRRAAALARKRKEYDDNVLQAFGKGESSLDQAIYHQIHIDVPRTNASVPLYHHKKIQESLERVLYCWAIRHPASGYVQGMNDLVTPFFTVFLSSYVDESVYDCDPDEISQQVLNVVEADSFWCLTKLLDGIQDNYTFAQPGIQRQIIKLKELIGRIDAPLYAHLQKENVEFIQFAFRWINCLLMREIPLRHIVRMWDTYLAEGPDGFSDFHIYVCAAFLVRWNQKLKTLDFQGIMMFLQSAPTQEWDDKDIELLLSEAFMWKSLFHNSPMHLNS